MFCGYVFAILSEQVSYFKLSWCLDLASFIPFPLYIYILDWNIHVFKGE